MKTEIRDKIAELITAKPNIYVRHFRTLCGLTQKQLAAKLSIANNSIQGHEYGAHAPHKSFVKNYAEFFAENLPEEMTLEQLAFVEDTAT